MPRTIEIKIYKTVFKFIETVYEEDNQYYVKNIDIKANINIKMIIRGRDHNPAHVHLYYLTGDFRFNLKTQDFFKKDISKSTSFNKFKTKKLLYKAVLSYFKFKKIELTDSFYILNPTLKS